MRRLKPIIGATGNVPPMKAEINQKQQANYLCVTYFYHLILKEH